VAGRRVAEDEFNMPRSAAHGIAVAASMEERISLAGDKAILAAPGNDRPRKCRVCRCRLSDALNGSMRP
jgi:hypothetical protein